MNRQIGFAPGFEPAAQALSLVVAELFGDGHGAAGASTGLAQKNNWQSLVLDRAGQLVFQLAKRNILGVGDVAGGKFIDLANVNHHGFFAVDQLHCSRSAEVSGSSAAGDEGPNQHTASGQRDGNQHPVVDQKFHF